MSRRWNSRIAGMVAAVAVLLLLGIGGASADPILVHQSQSDFYDTGGTLVSGCTGLGCSGGTFSFGDTSGTNTWSLLGLVTSDAGNTTYAYTLLNRTLSPNLSSFHVLNDGKVGTGGTPAGWSFWQSPAWWSFETFAPGTEGVAPGGSLNGFSVAVDGLHGVAFNQTFVTNSNGVTTAVLLSGTHRTDGLWMVAAPGAPIPEPATLLLLGSGLAGFGLWRRRAS